MWRGFIAIIAFLGVAVIAAAPVHISEIPGDPYSGTTTEELGFPLRYIRAQQIAPLVVDLHQWSGDEQGAFGNDAALDEASAILGWNYVRPNLGSNDTPEGCCSAVVIDRIEQAIRFSVEQGRVDERRIFVIGASGGGYAGLCAMMSDRLPETVRYNLWVPISDIEAWYHQTQGQHYSRNILQCTSSGDVLDVNEARARSPLYMPPPQSMPNVSIYAGVNDGWDGAVPITHSIRMFNRIAQSFGHPNSVFSEAEILDLLEHRGATLATAETLEDGTLVFVRREAGSARLVLFDGGHEGLTSQVVRDISAID